MISHIKPTIEICCCGIDDVVAAIEGGAGRLELCSALSAEGVTPSAGLLKQTLSIAGTTPVTVLIRPREGDFRYSDREIDVMVADIAFARQAGAHGVTIGALDSGRMPDAVALEAMTKAAGAMELTFHRAIDDCADPVAAASTLAAMGFARILSSGGAPTALEGATTLRLMAAATAGRLDIMPGGGVRPSNLATLHELTGATQFHSSARNKQATAATSSLFGPAPATVSADIVKQLTNITL